MKSETLLDYAVFQLSPKRSRCELFVSCAGKTEKLASGLVKPFVTHLKVAEEQVALAVNSIKLEVKRYKDVETWFTKATLERFVRFVSTPEVLELVNTLDAEMSQLEAARRIYAQGLEGGDGVTAAADATKKELLRAIDVRLDAVRQDLMIACSRAAAAGFTPDTVAELQLFAHQFGATRLHEACNKFKLLYGRRSDLIHPLKAGMDDRVVRSSYGSDMSIDEDIIQESYKWSSQPQQRITNQQLTTGEPDASEQHEHMGQSRASPWQQQKSPSITFPLQRSKELSIDKDEGKENDGLSESDKKEESMTQIEASQTSHPPRRLSVQDRINMFENKQKETSGSGGKLAIGKSTELRRLSSDVSSAPAAAEKAVLRRWSGASDMSIDLSSDKKEIESPFSTSSSSSILQSKLEERKNSTGLVTSDEPKTKSLSGRVDEVGLKHLVYSEADVGIASSGEVVPETKWGSGPQRTFNSGRSEDSSGSKKFISTMERGEGSGTLSKSSLDRVEDSCLKDQVASQSIRRYLPGGTAEQIGSRDLGKSKGSLSGDGQIGMKLQLSSENNKIAGLKDQAVPQTQQLKPLLNKEGEILSASEPYQLPHGEFQDKVDDVATRGQLACEYKAPTGTSMEYSQLEGGLAVKLHQVSVVLSKRIEGDLLGSQSHSRYLGEDEGMGTDLVLSELPGNFSKKAELGLQKTTFLKQISASEQLKMPNAWGNSRSNKMAWDDQEGHDSVPKVPGEQLLRVRQSKGNQELNDELKMKANELEKLFAEHKLRGPGDQSNSARRSKPAQKEQSANLPYGKPTVDTTVQFPDENMVTGLSRSSSSISKFSSTPIKMLAGQDWNDTLKQNFPELDFSEDSRGKLYERYMQKRDAKLREEWSSKRVEKEAKMKAMHDSLEQNRAEMKAKFSRSGDKQDSVLGACRRAERLRSFNTQSTGKGEQLQVDLEQNEDEEYLSEFAEEKPFSFDRSFGDASSDDGASRSIQAKKLISGRNLSSSTPRTSAAPVPKSANKTSNSSSGKRRLQSGNPLVQPVPNFSDLRKENAKLLSGASKTTRPQVKNSACSKSINEDMPSGKEEKPRRPQSLRKSSASPAQFKDSSLLNSKDIVLTPLKFEKEHPEHIIPVKISKDVEPKPFLRKGSGIGAGVGVARMKSLMTSETINNEEELDTIIFDPEESSNVVKDEEEEGSETMAIEDPGEVDNGKPRLSQDSSKLVNSGSESGDDVSSFSQGKPSLVADLPAALQSTFHPIGSMQDSPGESPISWNLHMQHTFAYAHETSDIDAYVDSPMGSPASWNSHSLNQAEADAARMRKKWGSAQKPFLLGHSSHNHSRKDVTKGFKRLLKFGRKSRGTESLVDWISATTSEGDDDTEDGRDLANRSSDDLRKSRMGFSQGHPLDDSLNEGELYNEQGQALRTTIPTPSVNFKLREDHLSGSSIKAPRSFFSLSSFRSKGSDSKPR